MAACLISITGTSGSVLIRYIIGDNPNTITADIGDPIYIDDTSLEVTYTTLSGDAIASSGCITITELPSACYLYEWETLARVICSAGGVTSYSDPIEMNFTDILIDGEEVVIPPVAYSTSTGAAIELGTSINSVADERFELVAYKEVASVRNTTNYSVVLRVINVDIPELIVTNVDTSTRQYIKGAVSACLPAGFTEFTAV